MVEHDRVMWYASQGHLERGYRLVEGLPLDMHPADGIREEGIVWVCLHELQGKALRVVETDALTSNRLNNVLTTGLAGLQPGAETVVVRAALGDALRMLTRSSSRWAPRGPAGPA